jgi:hypothetical protein
VAGTLAAMFLVAFSPATAQAGTGSQDACDSGQVTNVSHNNDWQFFIGHKIRANVAGCIKSKCNTNLCWWWWAWTRTPKITLPSTLPAGGGENVTVVKDPYVADIRRTNGPDGDLPSAVKYQFSVKQCVAIPGSPCQTFDFSVWYTYAGSRICSIGGACDDKKPW